MKKTTNQKRHPQKGGIPAWKIVLVVVVVLILAAIAFGATFLKTHRPSVDTGVPFDIVTVGPMDTTGEDTPVSGGVDTEPGDTTTSRPADNEYVRDTEVVNFLVMGRDKDAWNTDVIMLVNFNMREGSLSVLQIPRDTYIEIDSVRGRVNTMMKSLRSDAYQANPKLSQDELLKAGMQGTVELLEKSLCIQIDGYAIVNLEGFRNIIDAIGGVYMDVPYDMDYEDPYQNLYIHLDAGPQVLDGAKAEMFVRFRSGYVQGDIGRVNAQKIFLTALFKQLQNNLTVSTVPKLVEQIIKYVTTDVPLADIIIYAKELLGVDMAKVSMMTLPGSDARTEVTSGAWYYVMHRADTLTLINEYFNVYNRDITDQMFDSSYAFTEEDLSHFNKIYFAEATGTAVETADQIDGGELDIPLYQ